MEYETRVEASGRTVHGLATGPGVASRSGARRTSAVSAACSTSEDQGDERASISRQSRSLTLH